MRHRRIAAALARAKACLLDMVSRREAATERECPECLGKIPIAARKCMYCITDLTPPATTAVP